MADRFPDRSALEAHQLSKLRELLVAVTATNPFYQAKLPDRKALASITSLKEFFARVPFTTKAELAADHEKHPPYGSNLTFPIEHYTRCHQTSGSTGRPLRWLDTPESWSGLLDSWCEVYRAARVAAADRIYFAFSFGPFLGFWTAFEAGLRVGCLCLPGGGLSSKARLEGILNNQATVLCCTPTYALRLAEVAREQAVDLGASRIRLIIVAGEPGGSVPATRQAISMAWNGARVFDHHGMTEVGPVTHECYSRPGVLRIHGGAYLAEIINPATGAAVTEGTVGELVLTTLGRVGSPLIRYRTGDLVRALAAAANPDGEVDLCLDGGILGRTDDMLLVRGVNVYPTAVEQIVRECGGIAEYQVKITTERSLTEIELQIEAVEEAEATRRRLATLLQERLSLRVPVTVAASGTLPRFEMKARRWIRA
ncbi:MAG TPA: phenylacetate--CoA ligase [Verrucomicrobiales bacterium]|nr:phenylacetate--CoA ligase [Verrucomicrobiales bacterium]